MASGEPTGTNDPSAVRLDSANCAPASASALVWSTLSRETTVVKLLLSMATATVFPWSCSPMENA